jgi:hypothetical protein
MGPARWAEWLAFMQARGLEWGKPLSAEAPNAPAKSLPADWNVYAFPSGEDRAAALSRNGKIRQRVVAMVREAECLQRLAAELIRDDKKARHTFIALRIGLDSIWEDLEEAGILATET